jgi:hypothetical protein
MRKGCAHMTIELDGVEVHEVALWRSVIAQAFTDACMIIRPRRVEGELLTDPTTKQKMVAATASNVSDRDDAREWLLTNSEDFRDVCAMALLDSDAVMESAQAMCRKGWPPKRFHTKKTSKSEDETV